MSKICGIYKILNSINKKCYIGSSKDIKKRWKSHLSDLKHGTHPNSKLQNSWEKYSQDVFEFSIIEVVEDVKYLINREQFWMDFHKCIEEGYNITPIAGCPSLLKHSNETKLKMSLTKKGKKNSREHCKNISISKIGNQYGIGHKVSDENKVKLSLSMKGNKRGEGVIFTEERKAKLSLSAMGNKNVLGNTFRLGKTHSTETKKKMSESQDARRLRDSKLTDESAKAILIYPKKHGYISELSRIYGVSRDIIKHVLDGKTFKHLNEDGSNGNK